jgi:hypothetical protein
MYLNENKSYLDLSYNRATGKGRNFLAPDRFFSFPWLFYFTSKSCSYSSSTLEIYNRFDIIIPVAEKPVYSRFFLPKTSRWLQALNVRISVVLIEAGRIVSIHFVTRTIYTVKFKRSGACFTKELTTATKFYPAHYSLNETNLKMFLFKIFLR